MAIAVAEAQQAVGSGTITTPAFATSPSVGDLIIAVQTQQETSNTLTAPTDSAGHTFTLVGTVQSEGGTFNQLGMWILENITTGTGLGSYTVSANTSSGLHTIVVLRVTGNKTTSYNGDIVVNSLTTTTNGTNPSVGPTSGGTPTANSLFVGAVESSDATNNFYTTGTNIAWTTITNEIQSNGSSEDYLHVEHFVSGATTTQTATWTGGTAHWFGLVASFAPASTDTLMAQAIM